MAHSKRKTKRATLPQATHGTRFQLAFANIANGVRLSVPTTVTSGSLTMQLTASAIGAISPLGSGVLSSSGGTAVAYYEVTQTDDSQIESINIPVTATAAANFSNSAVSAFSVAVTSAPQNSADVPNFSTSTPAPLVMSAYALCGIPLTLTTTQPGVNSYSDDINVTYGPQFAAAGGTSPYTYSIFSGSLPPGQGINAATGEITGAATVTGDYIFTGKVMDSATPTPATATYTVTIHALADPAVAASTLPGGIVSAPYSTTLCGGRLSRLQCFLFLHVVARERLAPCRAESGAGDRRHQRYAIRPGHLQLHHRRDRYHMVEESAPPASAPCPLLLRPSDFLFAV